MATQNWTDCQRSFLLCRTILHQHTAGLCTEPDLQRVSRRSCWLRERQSQDRRSVRSRDHDWSNDCAGSGAEGDQMVDQAIALGQWASTASERWINLDGDKQECTQ